MKPKCRSQNRCALTSCASCARRYANRLARRILAHGAKNLHIVEIDISACSPLDFRTWRVAARNILDHLRRSNWNSWWRDCGLHVWLGADGKLRGVAFLGAVTPHEFNSAFGSRWPTALRPISSDNLRNEIFGAVRPGVIVPAESSSRYQALKLAIWPRRRSPPKKSSISAVISDHHIEPMPILI
jgi:hypothetical protein